MTLLLLYLLLAACSDIDDDIYEEGVTISELEAEEGDISSNTNNTPEIIYQPEGNGIHFKEEYEGAELHMVESSPSAYAGSWEATSDQAVYLYGNVDITINGDGTWKGNITEEDCVGTWEDLGDHLHMVCDLFSFDLAFETGGNLIMTETGSDYVLNTVLTKK